MTSDPLSHRAWDSMRCSLATSHGNWYGHPWQHSMAHMCPITTPCQTLQEDTPAADEAALASGFAKEEVKAPEGQDVHMYASLCTC